MLVSDFDELWQARPFKPFLIRTAGGQEVLVKSPEFAWHAPANRIVWVAEGAGESRVRMIDLHLATELVIEGGDGLPSSEPDEEPRSE